ncbi:MAG: HU family DNA-binding protein [Elusimicrobiaceae bacterium]|nr:HU family DNA-binding protein [Elusimicrobiaceae bacterium]
MNKEDVIRHLTRKLVDKKLAKTAVESVFAIIKHGLKRDKKVVISNFGSFQLKTARPVTRHNPRTLEKVQIPAKQKIRFKPSGNILKK